MPKRSQALSIPAHMKFIYEEIISLSDEYCSQKLNQEYAQLCRQAIATLCRKRPSPLERGAASSWACAVIYAIGSANFLFDKASQPYTTAQDLADAFGISKSTAGNKSKQVRDWLKISYFSHQLNLFLGAFCSYPALEEVDFSDNAIDDEGGRGILSLLEESPYLKIVLHGNPMSKEMSEKISRSINRVLALRETPTEEKGNGKTQKDQTKISF